MKTKRKKKLYVVGFDDDRQCINGKMSSLGFYKSANPMTKIQAKKMLKEMEGATIYKLVPIRPEDMK